MSRVHSAVWPPSQLTTSELSREREELEHRIGDDTSFATAEARDVWIKRLRAIKAEQSERAEARRRPLSGP